MALDTRYLIARVAYRPVSTRVARRLLPLGVTPTQVTWGSTLLVLAGAAAFAVSAYVVGAVLILIGVIADCVDGDLARLAGRTSRTGAFLDSVLDRWTDAAIIMGLAASDRDTFALAAGGALTTSLLTSYTRARAQSLGVDCPDGLGGRDARILVLVVAALAGAVLAGLWIVAVLGAVTTVHRMVAAHVALRSLDRDREAA